MMDSSKAKNYDFTYNPIQRSAELTFEAISTNRPDALASYSIVGPYCELRRSPHEHVILKLKGQSMLEALRKANDIYVTEQGSNGIVWQYRLKRRPV